MLTASVRTLSENIKDARERAGLSQSEVARRMGASQSTVNAWEKGRYKSLELHNLLGLAAAIGCRLDVLVKGRSEKYDKLVGELAGPEAEVKKSPPQGGGSDPTTARLLQQAEARHRAQLVVIETAARDLLTLVAKTVSSAEGAGTRTPPSSGRRRRRKTG